MITFSNPGRHNGVKKDVMIAGRATPELKEAFKDALQQAEGVEAESDFVRDCAQALIKQTEQGHTLAQPLRLLTEEWKRLLIRAGVDVR